MPTESVRSEILSAVRDELERSAVRLSYKVEGRTQQGSVWSLQLNLPDSYSKSLDESLEGASAWWPGHTGNGAADVLSVVPEHQVINLRFATKPPPNTGEEIRIYPPRYLEALQGIWQLESNAIRAEQWLKEIQSEIKFDDRLVPSIGASTSQLRRCQQAALKLPGYQCGFLWGPPGTGKTFTLGRLIAEYLRSFPTKRVLLLSTTNSATDIALTSVDDALSNISQGQQIRSRCKRLGHHFVAQRYQGRSHLLPVIDEDLIRKLSVHQALRPPGEAAQAYAAWKEKDEALRREVRRESTKVLDECQLAAMTATRAAYTHDELRSRGPFDLVVFDEASQVPIPYALVLASLGRKTIFAGDHKQLAPVVQSNTPNTVSWMGGSMFNYLPFAKASTVFLDEQSRMSESICELVSKCFYEGALRVAPECLKDRGWIERRKLPKGCKSLSVVSIEAESNWSQTYHGPLRIKSAEAIAEICLSLTKSIAESEILVLTPFKSQKAIIRQKLALLGLKGIEVSTVHRAQGGERHTVIFDPVDGSSPFLQTEESRRLMNVAISRAMARFIMFLSSSDRQNPTLRQMSIIVEGQDLTTVNAEPITKYMVGNRFCADLVGKTVVIQPGNRIGRVVSVSATGNRMGFDKFSDGARVQIDASAIAKGQVEEDETTQQNTTPRSESNSVTSPTDVGTQAADRPVIPRGGYDGSMVSNRDAPASNSFSRPAAPIVVDPAIDFKVLVKEGGFPRNALNKKIDINGRVGRIVSVDDLGGKFEFLDLQRSVRIKMRTRDVLNLADNK